MATFIWDGEREQRTGFAEAVLCEGKQLADLQSIMLHHIEHKRPCLYTRLAPEQWQMLCEQLQKKAWLAEELRNTFDYHEVSRTAIYRMPSLNQSSGSESKAENTTNMEQAILPVGIVTAGTSDLPVAYEAQRTLRFNGFDAPLVADVGVAGLWRLLDRVEDLNRYRILIAVAGMEAALFSVLAGLVKAPIIAVPSAVGYGVSGDGQAALSSALASCAPGVMTMNINNGFGAAAAAIKIHRSFSA